jgi:hypothetical protein
MLILFHIKRLKVEESTLQGLRMEKKKKSTQGGIESNLTLIVVHKKTST